MKTDVPATNSLFSWELLHGFVSYLIEHAYNSGEKDGPCLEINSYGWSPYFPENCLTALYLVYKRSFFIVKQLETRFKRIETKYVVSKENLEDLLTDLKEYLVEDDYPTSTISNIYFDTDNFDVIQDALDGNHRQEKIRMRTYLANPKSDSKVFLEVKAKDEEGIGHKFRLVSTPLAITNLMTDGKNHGQITDRQLLQDIHHLRQRYDEGLKPRMYIYYDRFSMKEKETIQGYAYNKVRVTLDQNLTYRDEDVSLFKGNHGFPLLDEDTIIMEIKAPGKKPDWLQTILDKHGLEEQKFSKYSCAYHKSQGLDYGPRPAQEKGAAAYV